MVCFETSIRLIDKKNDTYCRLRQARIEEMKMEVCSCRANAVHTDATAPKVYNMRRKHTAVHERARIQQYENMRRRKVIHSPKGQHSEDKRDTSYSMLAGVLHIIHFIVLHAAFSSPTSTKTGFFLPVTSRGLRRIGLAATTMPTKLDGLQLPSLTSPHAEEYHHSCTSKLKAPPE
jgi:hypothetical protein